jgi:site-specific DNA recombinase
MPPRRRPGPHERPPRLIGIIRVSREGGRGEQLLSPDLQRTAIQEHAARNGRQVVDWVEAIDESGSRSRSAWWPRLDSVIERVEAGEVDGVVAWKYSRFARNRAKWAVAVDRIERAGGVIESATEPVDATTSAGKFQRGVLAEVNAFFADQVGDQWRDVHRNRFERGLTPTGGERFGYRYDTERRLHVPDDVTGPVLAEVYRRYVAGESFYSLIRWLNESGIQTPGGYSKRGPGPWTDRTLRRVLDSGFAAGIVTMHDEQRPGAHEALIDAELWSQYQASRAGRRGHRGSERSQYLLSGLLRCVHQLEDGTTCGSTMNAGQFGHARAPKYRCKAAVQTGRHAGGYVTAAHVEREVRDWVEGLAQEIEGEAAKIPAPSRRDETPRLEKAIAELRAELVAVTRKNSRGLVPDDAYEAARDEINAEIAGLEARRLVAVAELARPDYGSIARRLSENWETLAVEHRRAMLRQLLARVEVEPGHVELVDGWWRSRVVPVPIWGDRRD